MRVARRSGEIDQELEGNLTGAKEKFDGLLEAVDRDLRVQWKVWDEGNEAGKEAERTAAQGAMVALLDRRRYLSNLVRDVTETLGAQTKVGG
jgi:molecular chaperone HscB